MKPRHGKEKTPSHVGNLILSMGAFLGSLLVVNTAAVMQKSEVTQTALTPDKAGNLRTSDLQALAVNALNYLTEQTGRSVLVSGSAAAVALIGTFAFAKRSHNRSRAAEKNVAEAKRASQRAARKAAMDKVALSVKLLGKQTDALIAESKAAPAKRIRKEFTPRAAELEANRPKGILNMSLGELVALAQTNRALPVREEAFYDQLVSNDTPQSRPMSRTVYRSLAAFKEFHDETIPQDSGYHVIPNPEQRGVHHLMPELDATPPIGHSDVTAAYPLVVPRPA